MWTEEGPIEARIPGKLKGSDVRPVVGDWVVVRPAAKETRIDEVLSRETIFVRRAAGRRVQRQAIAANVDVVFIVSGLDGDFSPRRLERYLTAVSDTGAQAVVLLTKAGMVEDPDVFVQEARRSVPTVPVHAIDVVDGVDPGAADPYLGPGSTAALVGSSGVGKSTLLNHWLGEARQPTGGVRARDKRGQHTTTAREMFVLPSGALVVDTPGMRELALWADPTALAVAFADIDAIARDCRFSDCRHDGEPECAVRAAVEGGELDAARFESYLRLRAEIENTSEQRRRR